MELGSRVLVAELALDIVVEDLALALGAVVDVVEALGPHGGEGVEPLDTVDDEEEARSSVGDVG